ncbi:MAG: hypothetical protein JWO68_4124 [Actinomycetia bacterium]|nr:hypothetical protein [Actinomycetes bacterium]
MPPRKDKPTPAKAKVKAEVPKPKPKPKAAAPTPTPSAAPKAPAKATAKAEAPAKPKAPAKATAKAEADDTFTLSEADLAKAAKQLAHLNLSEPWMIPWAAAATATGNIEAACQTAGVSLSVFTEARGRDAAFDEICRTHDQIVDLKITESLRSHAMNGDVRFQSLYYTRVRDRLLGRAGAEPADAYVSASMAEAMIGAGLLARAGVAVSPPAMHRPAPTPSQPRRKPTPKSGNDA